MPRICLTDEQILGLLNTRANAADDTLTATAEYIAPLTVAEWNKHRDDVLWNPDEAKKKAKEEDEKRNKEALAAKFAHVKDDPAKKPWSCENQGSLARLIGSLTPARDSSVPRKSSMW